MACRTCTRNLIQLHWFKVQFQKAQDIIQTNLCSFDTELLDSFTKTRTIINAQRTVNEKELLSSSNLIKEEPVEEIIIYEEIIGIIPEEPSVEVESTPVVVSPSRRNTRRSKVLNQDPAETPKKSKSVIKKDKPKSSISPKVAPQYSEEEIAKRPAVCSICGTRFVRYDYLVVHMRRHTGERPYQCKFCGKSFPRTTDLNVHERYHTNQNSHFCSVCNKGFNRPYNLKVHMRIHTQERPFKCPDCPKSYRQSNDLKTHIRKHTGERSICDVCGESFLLKHRLTQHKKAKHNIDVVSNIGRLAKFEEQ